jgi:hypothetical protein
VIPSATFPFDVSEHDSSKHSKWVNGPLISQYLVAPEVIKYVVSCQICVCIVARQSLIW